MELLGLVLQILAGPVTNCFRHGGLIAIETRSHLFR